MDVFIEINAFYGSAHWPMKNMINDFFVCLFFIYIITDLKNCIAFIKSHISILFLTHIYVSTSTLCRVIFIFILDTIHNCHLSQSHFAFMKIRNIQSIMKIWNAFFSFTLFVLTNTTPLTPIFHQHQSHYVNGKKKISKSVAT